MKKSELKQLVKEEILKEILINSPESVIQDIEEMINWTSNNDNLAPVITKNLKIALADFKQLYPILIEDFKDNLGLEYIYFSSQRYPRTGELTVEFGVNGNEIRQRYPNEFKAQKERLPYTTTVDFTNAWLTDYLNDNYRGINWKRSSWGEKGVKTYKVIGTSSKYGVTFAWPK